MKNNQGPPSREAKNIGPRGPIMQGTTLALGCSHTYGWAVEAQDTWAYKLGAVNHGVFGVSSDYVARMLPELARLYGTKTLYVLWPDWSRFEYEKDGKYFQSMPMDSDRIYFMEMATDQWLQENFQRQVNQVRSYCAANDIQLHDMTLYDLIPYIDHADRWPLASDGWHYSSVWHDWVADIFRKRANGIS